MAYRVKTYALREKATENGTRYFISFKDGQGGYHELEVSEQFFIEFRQMERRNRNLLQSCDSSGKRNAGRKLFPLGYGRTRTAIKLLYTGRGRRKSNCLMVK